MNAKHPAKFSDVVLDSAVEIFNEWGWPRRLIDPFAGIGKVHRITERRATQSVGVELEREWAAQHQNNLVGNALSLPFPDATFDGLCSSPVYGNRMSDHHDAQDASRRYSYRHVLGRPLHEDNSGQMQWGDTYRDFHRRAWNEALRVLQPDSLLIVNVSDHVRGGQPQYVTDFHLNHFLDHGCAVLDIRAVNTSRLRHGANREARARYENVFALRYVAPVYVPEEPDDEEDLHDGIDVPRGPGMADQLDAGEGGQRT